MRTNYQGIEWKFSVDYDHDIDPHWTDVNIEFGSISNPPQVVLIEDYATGYQERVKKACFEAWRASQ
jgi:hypothetical protein